jgi:nicotinamidase/pyrazinamidase
MDALIVVDIQNDFLPGGALGVPRGDEVVAVANRLMRKFDFVVATQDWHPAGHGSFASVHCGKKAGEVVELNGVRQVLWPDHCVQGTRGAEFAPGLDVSRIKHVVQKGTDAGIDSYSGFFDNGHKKDTGLGKVLKAAGVTRVYIVGLATDYCVKATALDARRLGFETVVVRDGVRGVELRAGDSERAMAEMVRAGARIAGEDEAPIEVLGQGKFLRLERQGKWEFATRAHGPSVVAVVPITDDGKVLLVEQFRAPLGLKCIEIPAGLVGDHEVHSGEEEEVAARRELMEETGHEASEWTLLGRGPTTPGLSDEVMAIFLARGLKRMGPVLGDGHEEITLHEVEIGKLRGWLREMEAAGRMIDVKVYSGLFLAAAKCPELLRAFHEPEGA